MAPIITPRCNTGIFPGWLPVEAALPDSPRCVLCTDGDGVWVGCYQESGEPELGGFWEDAQLEDCFDSVITHWMELPEPPGLD
jgi:hypothetical protein